MSLRSILRLGKSFRLYILNVCFSKIPFAAIRLPLYKIYVRLGRKSNICQNVRLLNREMNKDQIQIGDNSVINPDCLLDGREGKIIIGNNVAIARGSWMFTLEHDPHDDYFGTRSGDVIIEDHVWIASKVVVLPGGIIGQGSVVASGAVVTKSIPPMSIAGGVPAKVIGQRKSALLHKQDFFPDFYV
jgi:acetyltransferase-like isoleucine patch superfamily enzyme